MKQKKGFTVFLGVITAILIGMLLLASQGYSPIKSYGSILKYSLSTQVGMANTINRAVFLLAAVYLAVIFFMLKSRTGYEFRIMGQNSVFAKAGGCRTDKNFIKVMLIMGASQQHRFLGGLGESYANDGLMISIVAGNNVTGVFLYAIIFSVFQSGATGMQLDTWVPSEFTTMLIAITVLSVVAFRSYSGIFMDKLTAMKKTRSFNKEAKKIGSAR